MAVAKVKASKVLKTGKNVAQVAPAKPNARIVGGVIGNPTSTVIVQRNSPTPEQLDLLDVLKDFMMTDAEQSWDGDEDESEDIILRTYWGYDSARFIVARLMAESLDDEVMNLFPETAKELAESTKKQFIPSQLRGKTIAAVVAATQPTDDLSDLFNL